MWFKWFKKSAEQPSVDGMPELLANTWAEFQSSEYTMPLDSLIQLASFNTKQNSLHLTLKFPWASLADELLHVLQQVQPASFVEAALETVRPAAEAKGIRLEPANATAWNSRCWARAVIGQLQPALADCTEALRPDKAAGFGMVPPFPASVPK